MLRAMPREAFNDDITEFLGFRHDGPGRIRLTVTPALMNGGGMLSGIVPFGLVDYAMGSALWHDVTDEESVATLNIAINYATTAREGGIVCVARVDRRTRTNAVLSAEVRTDDEEARLLASAIGSYVIFPRRTR